MVKETRSMVWSSFCSYFTGKRSPYPVENKRSFKNVVYDGKLYQFNFAACYINGEEKFFVVAQRNTGFGRHWHVRIKEIWRVTKEEGNALYKDIKATQFTSKAGALCYRYPTVEEPPAQLDMTGIIDF